MKKIVVNTCKTKKYFVSLLRKGKGKAKAPNLEQSLQQTTYLLTT
jgi:hypothetical protein